MSQPTASVQPDARDESDKSSWEVEKSLLEQQNFNLNQENAAIRDKLADVSTKNASLLDEITRTNNEINENFKQRKHLETMRNELMEKNIELESKVSRLKIEKEEYDALMSQTNKEKQAALVELFALKDQLKSAINEKTELSTIVETLRQEKRSLMYDRDKFDHEKVMHAESRTWFLKEISDRDTKIASLRIEMANVELRIENEKMQLEGNISSQKLQISNLNEKLDMANSKIQELKKTIEENETAYNQRTENLEAELKGQVRLTQLEKSAREEAWNTAQTLNDELKVKDDLYKEAKDCLTQMEDEFKNEKESINMVLSEKETEIENLKQELEKMNKLMQSKHAVNFNVSEQELSEYSPIAAHTVRLLKGGQSLSNIVREHASTSGEVAALKEQNESLMNTLQELIKNLEESGSDIVLQNQTANELYESVEEYKRLLKEADEERSKIIGERDGAFRELAFTQTELEKYQRDYNTVLERNVQLMYVNERKNKASDEEWDDESDRKLFTNIYELQKRNVQLENDIEHEKKSAAEAAMAAQSAEMLELKAELTRSRETEQRLTIQIEQLKSAMEVLRNQSDNLKELVRDSVSAAEARNARIKADEAMTEKTTLEMKLSRLEDYIGMLKEERDKREQILSEKLEAAENAANTIKKTNVTLQVMFDTQKEQSAELQKVIESYQKEVELAMEEKQKVMVIDAKKSEQLNELTKQLVAVHDDIAKYRVQNKALCDEIDCMRSEIGRLESENKMHLNVLAREQQLMMSLNEMSTRLSRVENEKMNFSNNQLDALRTERDGLKSSAARLSDQLTHLKNESKIAQSRLEQNVAFAESKLKEKDEQISVYEKELIDLRSKLASVQAEFTGTEATGLTPDRLKKEYQQLKNRTQFLEKQLDELRAKLLEAEADKSRRDNEQSVIEKHSNVLEENLKSAEKMGVLERERLEAKAKSFERRAEELSQELTKIREENELLKTKLNEASDETEKQTFELKRNVEVLKVELDMVKSEKNDIEKNSNDLKMSLRQKESEIDQMRNDVSEKTRLATDSEARCAQIQSQLNDKTMALIAETDAKNQADMMRVAAENSLAKLREEINKIETTNDGKLRDYEQKIDAMSKQFESISSLLASKMDSMQSNELTMEQLKDTNGGMIESLQNLVQFVREEKEKAIERAMNAEVEMRRLRAETCEYERGRNEMLVKIRDLEAEKASNAAALIERAKLLEKVNSLMNVQSECVKLNKVKVDLSSSLMECQQQKSEIEKRNTILSTKLNELNMKLSSNNQELIQKKKECEMLKQKIDTTGRGQNSAIQNQLEQAKTLLAQARQEAEDASQRLVKCEKEKSQALEQSKTYNTKFSQTRQLAVKFRDRVKELESTKNGTLLVENEKLKKEIESLKADMEEQKKNVSDAEERLMRMNMLEMRMTSLTKKVEELTAERDKLLQDNKKIKSDLEKANSSMATSSSTTTGSSSVTNFSKSTDKSAAAGAEPSLSEKMSKSEEVAVNIPQNVPSSSAAQSSMLSSVSCSMGELIPPVPSETIPDPTPPSNNFYTNSNTLPVPQNFQASDRVPTQSLFSSATDRVKKTMLPNIDSSASVTYSFATSTGIQAPATKQKGTTSDTMPLPEESVSEAAGQSSQVSGSIDDGSKQLDSELNTNDGESRDSSAVGGVSSSDGRGKKRMIDEDNDDTSEAKRLRPQSPNEAVTSSGNRPPRHNPADIPELDEVDHDLGLEQDISDEDPNETISHRANMENDEEVLEDIDEVMEEDDQSFGNDEDFDEEQDNDQEDTMDGTVEHEEGDDNDIIVITDEEDVESLNDLEDEENDDENTEELNANNEVVENVIDGEDSQPSLDDQDREAASAMEEAEDEGGREPVVAPIDEGNAPADPTGAGVGSNDSQPDVPRIRPLDRDDQCSSSNETSEGTSVRLTTRNLARSQRVMRGGPRPARGIYQAPRRGGRGAH